MRSRDAGRRSSGRRMRVWGRIPCYGESTAAGSGSRAGGRTGEGVVVVRGGDGLLRLRMHQLWPTCCEGPAISQSVRFRRHIICCLAGCQGAAELIDLQLTVLRLTFPEPGASMAAENQPRNVCGAQLTCSGTGGIRWTFPRCGPSTCPRGNKRTIAAAEEAREDAAGLGRHRSWGGWLYGRRCFPASRPSHRGPDEEKSRSNSTWHWCQPRDRGIFNLVDRDWKVFSTGHDGEAGCQSG